MSRRRWAFFVSVFLVVSGLGVPVPAAASYYVSPSGADASPGSVDQPWRTFSAALRRLRPGDTLYARGGTYMQNVTGVSIREGTAAAPVRVLNYPGERPVISGLFWLNRPSYWIASGINVTWNPANTDTTLHMVKITNGIGWTLSHAEIWGARSFADLLISGSIAGEPAEWTVADNCIHDASTSHGVNQDHNVYANVGLAAGSGVIERNVIFSAPNGEGIRLGGSAPGGAANVTVRNNLIYKSLHNILVGYGSHDNLIDHNVLAKVGPTYGNIRGYRLTGERNQARGNVGLQATMLILNDPGYRGVQDGGGNVFVGEPAIDSPMAPTSDGIGCAGLRTEGLSG